MNQSDTLLYSYYRWSPSNRVQ